MEGFHGLGCIAISLRDGDLARAVQIADLWM